MIDPKYRTLPGEWRYEQRRKRVGWILWPFIGKHENFTTLSVRVNDVEFYDNSGYSVESRDVVSWPEMTEADALNLGLKELWDSVYWWNKQGLIIS